MVTSTEEKIRLKGKNTHTGDQGNNNNGRTKLHT